MQVLDKYPGKKLLKKMEKIILGCQTGDNVLLSSMLPAVGMSSMKKCELTDDDY
jgi:hypothetical protein